MAYPLASSQRSEPRVECTEPACSSSIRYRSCEHARTTALLLCILTTSVTHRHRLVHPKTHHHPQSPLHRSPSCSLPFSFLFYTRSLYLRSFYWVEFVPALPSLNSWGVSEPAIELIYRYSSRDIRSEANKMRRTLSRESRDTVSRKERRTFFVTAQHPSLTCS